MRIIELEKKKNCVEVEVEDEDDLWHLYNMIEIGDQICGNTTREIKVTRGDQEERVGRRRVFLCIVVEDTGIQSFTGKLRVRGKIVSGPEDMNILGSYHSFALGPRDRLMIVKENWTSFFEERLDRAVKKSRPRVVVVTLDDQEATIYIIKDYEIHEVVSMASNMPGKYLENSDRSSLRSKYFNSIEEELMRIIKDGAYSIVLAGPGFTKNEFGKYLKEKHRTLNVFEESTSTVGTPGVREVMSRGALSKILEDTLIVRDSRLVDEFLSRLSKNPKLVAYGLKEVEKSINAGAVEALLVSDRLIKTAPLSEKRNLEGLCRNAEKYGGKVFFIGSEHEKGSQLYNLGGIAALLRFQVN
ncbi:MAG: mRNA surveillance protein pelota [Candidatus Methanosuratincola petrocarbonis]|nr:mRNA surveillance protein pelota [Candidatus Methanosuratincola sp.]